MRAEPGPPPPPGVAPGAPVEESADPADGDDAQSRSRWNRWDALLAGAFGAVLIAYVVGSRFVSAAVERDARFTGQLLPLPTQLVIDLDRWAQQVSAFGSPIGSFLPFFFFFGAMLSTHPARRRVLASIALALEVLVVAIYAFAVIALPRMVR